MSQYAFDADGNAIDACQFSELAWERLKTSGKLGDFVMPCCKSPAVLKTSMNGLPFFAHYSDECATAPETIWHQSGKIAVLAALRHLGVSGRDEVPGSSPDGEKWKADILINHAGRVIAIELQRSYQHQRDFLRRQNRYKDSGVECYWLLRQDVFSTLTLSTAKTLIKRDFGGKMPPGGVGVGALPELPVALLNMDLKTPVNFGCMKFATIEEWLLAILENKYRYFGGIWCI